MEGEKKDGLKVIGKCC